MRRLLPGLCLALALLLPAPAAARDVPAAQGYVTDTADLLAASTVLRLDEALRAFERSDSTQLAVLTIPSLEGESLEEYSLKVAEAWGIGQGDRDNGALLLIARDERRMRIEVGYGLEGRLTDLLAGRIVDNEIAPRFKRGDYDGGVVAGVAAMMEAVRGEYQGTGRSERRRERNPLGFLALLLFAGPFLLGILRPRRLHGRRHGGFWIGGPPFGGGFGGRGGGGFGGFSGGGGGFGGGGASGGW